MTDFLLYALFAGLGVALVAGPLGCFVVWRRMAYFGDTLAHSALLGVALGVLLEINLSIAVTLVPLVIALGLVFLEQRGFLSLDTLLGILSHSALAAGLVVISLLPDVRVDLMSLLFGDLLSVTINDLWVIYTVAAAVLLLLGTLWKKLINITVDPELAAVEGTNVVLVRTALMLITALVIAIAMKIVGNENCRRAAYYCIAYYSRSHRQTFYSYPGTNGPSGKHYRYGDSGYGASAILVYGCASGTCGGFMRRAAVHPFSGFGAEKVSWPPSLLFKRWPELSARCCAALSRCGAL